MKRIFALAAAGCMLPAVAPADTVVLDDNMATSANWEVRRTRDAGATFGDDWSAVAITSQAGLPGDVVPASPTSSTVGLRMEANNNNFDGDTAAVVAGLTVWATTEPATANYDIEVTMFSAYSAPPIDIGGTGSTENFGIVFQNDNITSIVATRNTGLQLARDPGDPVTVVNFSTTNTATGLLNNGLVFGIAPDQGNGIGGAFATQGANANLWIYDRATSDINDTRVQARGFVGFWAGAKGTTGFNVWDSPARLASRALTVAAQAEVNNMYQDIYPPTRVAPHNTGLGYLWITPKVQVRGNSVTFRINDIIVATYTSNKTGKRFGLSMEDQFSGVNTPFLGRNYISRVKVTDVTILASAADWALYE